MCAFEVRGEIGATVKVAKVPLIEIGGGGGETCVSECVITITTTSTSI